MNFSFQVAVHCHELFLSNSQVVQNSVSFIFILPNIIENRLCKVLHHIFSLRLLLLETGLHISQVTVGLPFENRITALIIEVIIY